MKNTEINQPGQNYDFTKYEYALIIEKYYMDYSNSVGITEANIGKSVQIR